MSLFDENPFGEPTIDNPFADPSIQQVARNTNPQLKVDNYNPYEDNVQNTMSTSYAVPNSGPAIMQPTVDPPVYTKSSQQAQNSSKPTLDTSELQRRQEELERKEQDLARREEELRNAPYNVRRNNWPPLPEQCCFQPCFYQDIQVDIPLEFQTIVRKLYYLWIYHGALLILNVIGGLIIQEWEAVELGILYVLLFTPFGYLCWFRPAYKAFRSDSSFNFMVFFFIFFFQFVITAIQTIGIPHFGTIGIYIALCTFKSSAWSIIKGIIALLIAIGFGFAAVADLFLISKIHHMYKSTGASFTKAQQEFTTEFFSNQHVREAAGNVAAAAVSSQLNQNNSRY